jgi:hypothetical protein
MVTAFERPSGCTSAATYAQATTARSNLDSSRPRG